MRRSNRPEKVASPILRPASLVVVDECREKGTEAREPRTPSGLVELLIPPAVEVLSRTDMVWRLCWSTAPFCEACAGMYAMGMMFVEWDERKLNSEMVACDSRRWPCRPAPVSVVSVAPLRIDAPSLLPWWSPKGLSGRALCVLLRDLLFDKGLLFLSKRSDCLFTGCASPSPGPGEAVTSFSPLPPPVPILNSLSGLGDFLEVAEFGAEPFPDLPLLDAPPVRAAPPPPARLRLQNQ